MNEMSYNPLTNKWRPKNLDDIIGQDDIIYSLKNIIKSKCINNSYIIHGEYGTGKTSLARIFVKCINCKTEITIKPCNKCLSCFKINNDTNIDSIEIDAASKTKVEELKEIINQSNYKTTISRFKTYIIDECHMLSINSFNYLLKILEEPKNNVIYIFITTKINKIPETIISRCINLKLNKISKYDMKNRIEYILKNENITFDNDSINKLIDFSNGSMRDILNTIEKFDKTKNLNSNELNLLLGLTDDEKILLIIKYIIEKKYINIILLTREILKEKNNEKNIINQIQVMLYKIILYKNNIIYEKKLIENNTFIYLSKILTKNNIENIYKNFSKEKIFIKLSPNLNIGLELAFLNISIKI